MTTWKSWLAVDRIMMDLTHQAPGRAKTYLAEAVGAGEFETLYQGVRFRVIPNPAGITHVVIGRLAAGTYTLGCQTLREDANRRSLRIHHELRNLSGDELRSAFEQALTRPPSTAAGLDAASLHGPAG
ncbi:hypothetical protein [[Mycobacterium] vasticus]|uniref:Uncharacterized protein n=1 Tax=[Mycobacterium] vasticus TaxID=2875777 RepID=A0ABU5Z3K3_9MYCO|nr:hypothetical protein [Mycolicibacter sp. MYC017]MEB3071976.1 hypothetical protein [Mycolicibacter sp. MYC017]